MKNILSQSRWNPRYAIVALAILIVSVFWALEYRQVLAEQDAARREAQAISANLARAFEEYTVRSFSEINLVLDQMIEDYLEKGAAFDPLRSPIRKNLPADMSVQMGVIDAEGKLAFTDVLGGKTGIDLSDREHFRYFKFGTTNDLFIGKPLIGRASGKWSVQLAKRITDAKGQFAGVFVFSLDPYFLARFYESINLGNNGMLALVGNDGVVRSRDELTDKTIGQSVAGPEFAKILAAGGGAFSGPSLIDAVERIASYRVLKGFPLIVAVGFAEEDVMSRVASKRRNALFMGLAVFLIGFGSALYLLRQTATQEKLDADLRKKSDELLREQSLLRTLIDSMPDLISVKDGDGRYRIANKAFSDSFGFPEKDVIGKTSRDIFPPLIAGHTEVRDQTARIRSTPMHSEEIINLANGTARRYDVSRIPILLDEGQIPGLVLVAHDVTDRRRAEAELAAQAEALRRSNSELEQFAYVASHDLREPLRTISAYVTLLERHCADRLDDEGREFIDLVRQAAKRMNQLILDLLDFSRTGRSPMSFVPVNIGLEAQTALTDLEGAIQSAKASVRIEGSFPTVMGDAEQIRRLFTNLIGNAVKYSDPARAPEIRIFCSRKDKEWVISVADNGIGIEPKYFEKIFIIFQRLHTADRYEGTGIGLAICKKIVERHGGRIWVESEEGKGATFSFALAAE